MKVSIASYSFHGLIAAGVMDVFGYLETCRYRYGLSTADLWINMIHKDADVYLNDEFLKKLKAALDERELTLVNYAVDKCHLWEDDAATRAAYRELALRHLHAAEVLGAKTFRIDAGGKGEAWTSEQFDYIVKTFGEYSRIAANAGLRVGPENHWGPEKSADHMETLARAVDHPGFGILMHIGRWLNAGSDDGDRRLAKWAMHTHLDQTNMDTRLETAMKILLEGGYRGCWGLERQPVRDEHANATVADIAVQVAMIKRAQSRLAAQGLGTAK